MAKKSKPLKKQKSKARIKKAPVKKAAIKKAAIKKAAVKKAPPTATKKPAKKTALVSELAGEKTFQISHEPTKIPWAKRNYVGIRLFAGAPDPRWEIPADLAARIERELSALPAIGDSMDFPEEGAFYGGMVVQILKPENKRRGFLVFDETVLDYDADVIRRDADREFEKRLFRSMPAAVNQALDSLSFEMASAPALAQHGVTGAAPAEPRPRCEGAPQFVPPPPRSKWDKFPGIQDNNCYNFANDEFSDIDDAEPGRREFVEMTIDEMHQRLISDRLIPVAPDRMHLPNACHPVPGANLIAVAMRRPSGHKMVNGVQETLYGDFHCFRLDAGGTWSHKDGAHRSRNTDMRRNPLVDLATGKFAVRHFLVGYYWSVPGQRRIDMARA